MPPDLTFEQLQWDLEALEKAETAFEAEASSEYDFTPIPKEESQSTDRESDLAAQTV